MRESKKTFTYDFSYDSADSKSNTFISQEKVNVIFQSENVIWTNTFCFKKKNVQMFFGCCPNQIIVKAAYICLCSAVIYIVLVVGYFVMDGSSLSQNSWLMFW